MSQSWYLGLDSELLFVGDAGTTEAGRPSRRVGLESANYARVAPWLSVDADLAFTRARFRDDGPAGTRIPGALDRVISAGVAIEPSRPLFGSLRVRHFGPRPLIEDASVTSKGTTLWNGEAGYRLSAKARIVLEAFNIFDADVSDIDYFYRSRLQGEPGDGVVTSTYIRRYRVLRDWVFRFPSRAAKGCSPPTLLACRQRVASGGVVRSSKRSQPPSATQRPSSGSPRNGRRSVT